MQGIDNAQISVDSGILGDFRGTQKDRQITILSESDWLNACQQLGAELAWTTGRANLLVDGIEFDESCVGPKLVAHDLIRGSLAIVFPYESR